MSPFFFGQQAKQALNLQFCGAQDSPHLLQRCACLASLPRRRHCCRPDPVAEPDPAAEAPAAEVQALPGPAQPDPTPSSAESPAAEAPAAEVQLLDAQASPDPAAEVQAPPEPVHLGQESPDPAAESHQPHWDHAARSSASVRGLHGRWRLLRALIRR